MKRSTRISLLVFTICAAIFAFGALWYTRPNSPSYIIEEARQRQQVPLLEVKEPATRMEPIDIDYDKLAAAVSPKVKDSLKNDSDFINEFADDINLTISNLIKDYTTSTLVPSINSKITTLVDQLSTSLYNDLSSNLTEDMTQLSEDLSTQLSEDLQSDLTKMVDDKIQMTLDSIDINTYLPQLVDALTPVVVGQVYDMVEANKDDFIQVSQEISSSQFTENDAKALYIEYRTQIINDIVPIILDEVESVLQANIQTYLDSQDGEVTLETAETTTKTLTDTTTQDSTLTSDSEKETTTVDEVSAVVVAQVSDSSDTTSNDTTVSSDDEIAIPTFYPTQTKTLTAEEYQAQRTEIRNEAIADALSKLSDQ